MAEARFDTPIEGADGTYSVVLSPDFVTPLGGPFGGYLATLLLRAAGMHATLPRPLSLHCQFLNAAAIDRVDISTVTLRSSSRAHAVRVSMTQADKPIAEAIVWFTAKLEGLDHGPVAVPSPPHPETVRSVGEVYSDYTPTGFDAQLDTRPVFTFALDGLKPSGPPPWTLGELMARGAPQEPSLGGWQRLRGSGTFDDPLLDAGRAIVALDSLPLWAAQMPNFGRGMVLLPSLDLTVRLHDHEWSSEWLYCEAASPVAKDGIVLTGGTVWSMDGKLVATGTQQTLQRVGTWW